MKSSALYLLVFASALLTVACSNYSVKETDKGVTISLAEPVENGPRLLRLEVMNDRIIRVSATPEKRFPERKSLIIVEQEDIAPAFELERQDGQVVLSTAALQARVSTTDGSVTFTDREGHTILKEPSGGGKTFRPASQGNASAFSFRQVFESPPDEAFFGLGQHQSDEWNYKGKNEVLYQYNTKVSVPLVVSDRNYGILWDNYSLTKWGDPRDYRQMDSFILYDADGKEGGLTATYTAADNSVHTRRVESEIDYEFLSDQGKFPEGFPFFQSQITWQGEIEAPESGTYEFKLYYAGYTTVEVDGEEVVGERWRTAWNPNTFKFRVDLEAGQRVPVLLSWKPDGGVSYIGLKALGPLDPVQQEQFSLWSEMGRELDYYFISGENLDGVISGYRTLTGKAPIMPQWAYGFWQSRERYKTQEEILGTLEEFRRREIPIDNIVQDWSYWEQDQWGSHEFDATRFPDPGQMVRDIHDMNARVMISVWPKFYINTEHFRELDSRGWMYRQAVEDSIRDWIGRGYIGSFYDPYAKGARDLFWEQMNEHLYSLGIDAWWMDASEPDILSNASLEYRKKLSGPTAMGSSTEFLNTYSLLNAQGIFEGQRQVDPNKRVFLLTRSGFAGLQRYSAATWSGDIGTRWEDMKAQITAGMNFALSGIPHWTMDIGGFCVETRYTRAEEGSEDLEEWRELNTRWYQFGTFVPLYRAHGQYPFREVFHIAPETHPAYWSIVKYNKMRYRLMPYIYSLAGKVYFDDYTIMRALVMDFTGDRKATGIDDQYMFGPSLMISPVYTYEAREREVYFPAGAGWFGLESGSFTPGGTTAMVNAPYGIMPIHVKSGSILPVGPEIQFTGEKPDEPVTLWVYGGADGNFTLYEDEGLNYNYEKGAYSMIPLTYTDSTRTLVIGDRRGSYDGMVTERDFRIIFVDPESPRAFNPDARADEIVEYNGNAVTIKL